MVSYELENQEEFNSLLKKLGGMGSSRFLMGQMAKIVKKFSKANFTLKGDGKYEELSTLYKKRKSRIKPSAPIMVYSGALRDSIVGDTKDSILRVTEFSAVIGTSLPYAAYHDRGNENLPMRKPLFLTKKMVEQMIKTYEANIEKGIKSL
jgi:phage gpG-like protein